MIKDQTNSQFRQQAKELAEELNGVIGHAVIKYTHGIIEEMHCQLQIRDARILKLKNAIGLAASCLQAQLGELAIYQLVQALEWDEVEPKNQQP